MLGDNLHYRIYANKTQDPIQRKKFNSENLWADLTLRKAGLINFGLIQLSACNTGNEASQYQLLGMNSLNFQQETEFPGKRLSQTSAQYSLLNVRAESTGGKGLKIPCQNTFKDKPAS